MKNIDGILDLLDHLLPSDAKKTVMYCEIEEQAYEVFYYSYFADGSCKQCYELEAEDRVDAEILADGFENIAAFIRDSKEYNAEKRNVVTVVIEGVSENIKVDQYDKSVGLYKIKKEWKEKNL